MNEKIISEIREIIRQNFEPDKIILFGSYAYGKSDEESDIDLLIVKDLPKNKIRERRYYLRSLLRDIISTYQRDIDILLLREKDIKERIEMGDLFIREIYEKGHLIYAK